MLLPPSYLQTLSDQSGSTAAPTRGEAYLTQKKLSPHLQRSTSSTSARSSASYHLSASAISLCFTVFHSRSKLAFFAARRDISTGEDWPVKTIRAVKGGRAACSRWRRSFKAVRAASARADAAPDGSAASGSSGWTAPFGSAAEACFSAAGWDPDGDRRGRVS